MSLTQDQEKAKVAVNAWWEGTEKEFVLSGEPGTGKTFCAKQVVDQLKGAIPLYTAPTNEAVNQLSIALGKVTTEPCTTFVALGLSMVARDGEQVLEQVTDPKLENENLLIIDEASMAGLGKTLGGNFKAQLVDYVRDLSIRVLWIGDPMQLPPVNDSESPVFMQDLPTYHLTEVVRHGGSIGAFVKALRTWDSVHYPEITEDDGGIQWVKTPDIFKVMFQEENFARLISGEAKFIAWTNKRVDDVNQRIREHRYGKEVATEHRFCPGDHVLFKAPLRYDVSLPHNQQVLDKFYKSDKCHTIVNTNVKAEVVKVERDQLWGVDCYDLTLSVEGLAEKRVLAPTAEGLKQLNKLCQVIAVEAKAAKRSGNWKASSDYWKQFFGVKTAFADLKLAYAITGHRSQGSTVPYVYADAQNLLSNRDKVVGRKNFLVACSRAQKQLTIVSNKPVKWRS